MRLQTIFRMYWISSNDASVIAGTETVTIVCEDKHE